MIIGLGIDLIEIHRVQRQISENAGFVDGLFTRSEIAYCESKHFSKAQHYAARYAAKEAFFKALGTGWRGGMRYLDIELLDDPLGKPQIFLSGTAQEQVTEKKVSCIHVSITHTEQHAIAVVIIEAASQ